MSITLVRQVTLGYVLNEPWGVQRERERELTGVLGIASDTPNMAAQISASDTLITSHAGSTQIFLRKQSETLGLLGTCFKESKT